MSMNFKQEITERRFSASRAGVRPSPGAATSESRLASEDSELRADSEIAAPEDAALYTDLRFEGSSVGRTIPPHPSPLPQGEGEGQPDSRTFAALTICQPTGHNSPSPRGEGRGEGELTMRNPTTEMRVMSGGDG